MLVVVIDVVVERARSLGSRTAMLLRYECIIGEIIITITANGLAAWRVAGARNQHLRIIWHAFSGKPAACPRSARTVARSESPAPGKLTRRHSGREINRHSACSRKWRPSSSRAGSSESPAISFRVGPRLRWRRRRRRRRRRRLEHNKCKLSATFVPSSGLTRAEQQTSLKRQRAV